MKLLRDLCQKKGFNTTFQISCTPGPANLAHCCSAGFVQSYRMIPRELLSLTLGHGESWGAKENHDRSWQGLPQHGWCPGAVVKRRSAHCFSVPKQKAALRTPFLNGSPERKHIPAQMVQLTHCILCPNLGVY